MTEEVLLPDEPPKKTKSEKQTHDNRVKVFADKTKNAIDREFAHLPIGLFENKLIVDKMKWTHLGHDFRFVKNETTYGLLEKNKTSWERFGRWYFFKNATLLKSTSFLHNKKNGIEYFYTDLGFLRYQCFYKDGVKDGNAATYSSDAELLKILCYSEGKLVDCGPPAPCIVPTSGDFSRPTRHKRKREEKDVFLPSFIEE